jgi:P-type conjugative transfer ATPase TrbB
MSELTSTETRLRRRAMLLSALGPAITQVLQDRDVVDILVNADGRLWVERRRLGRMATGLSLTPHEAERIIRLVASHVRTEASAASPIVSAEIPESGERFEGLLPPVVPAPCFAIRKPFGQPISLDHYVADGTMTLAQQAYLRAAVAQARNILICGGTGCGKTTLANALIGEIEALDQRIVIIEDIRELHCEAADMLALRTKPGVVGLADLVRSTMRLRPDRIIIGEIRGGEALELLKAWNTGHPGGIATVHANSARAALWRLEQLVQEAIETVPKRLIAEAIDLIAFLSGRGQARRLETLAVLRGLDAAGEYWIEVLGEGASR